MAAKSRHKNPKEKTQMSEKPKEKTQASEKPQPKFVGAFTIQPSEAWQSYRDKLFGEKFGDMPEELENTFYITFLLGLSHGAALQGELALSVREFANSQISDIID